MEESVNELNQIWASCIGDYKNTQHKGKHSPCLIKELPAPDGYNAQICTRTAASTWTGPEIDGEGIGTRARVFKVYETGRIEYVFESGDFASENGTRKKAQEALATLAYVQSLRVAGGKRGKIQGSLHG
jgi:hypothetical protein